jgi:hypothetical protein
VLFFIIFVLGWERLQTARAEPRPDRSIDVTCLPLR